MSSPAAPILASILLDRELELEGQEQLSEHRTWTTGIHDLDKMLPRKLWTSGKVIGVLAEESPGLIEHLIARKLLSVPHRISQSPDGVAGFIIAPHHSTTVVNIHSILRDRVSHPTGDTDQNIAAKVAQYLNDVQVLQYFDFAGLIESVAEVSSRLFETNVAATQPNVVLYLEGLGATIEATQRRSGLVQANALLSSLLRTIAHLSRTYAGVLTLLSLGLGKDSRGEDATPSAFSYVTGNDMMMQPGGALGKTLDAGLDVMILVQDAHGTATDGSVIVEVVKDRVGDALGQWAVWKNR